LRAIRVGAHEEIAQARDVEPKNSDPVADHRFCKIERDAKRSRERYTYKQTKDRTKIMAEFSKIEWTDHTFNPWIGCQKISPGCDHCYAERQNSHWKWNGGSWGPHAPRKRTSEAYWRMPIKWNEEAGKSGIRRKVFCASLADWLDNRVPQSWRADLGDLIRATPNLDWLLLTKRIENYERFAPWPGFRPNVWLGVTAEDQKHYNRRWPILSELPAAVHFVSYEPALGPLNLMSHYEAGFPDWIICGGESGSKARYMEHRWAERLLKECRDLQITFFMKQMTKRAPIPARLRVREFPKSYVQLAA
jgi:protein gp37